MMNCLLVLTLLLVAGQGLSTALRNQVKSLVGKDLARLGATAIKINEIDEDGRNILHYAAKLGDLPLVEFLTANGVNTKLRDKDGLLPLDHAITEAEKNHSSQQMLVVSHILEKTYGVNGVDDKGWPAINWTILAGDLTRIEELIDRGSEVRFLKGRSGTLAVIDITGNNEIFTLIATKYKNSRDVEERTPLFYVSWIASEKLTKLFLKAGADPNATDRGGVTPLHDSSWQGNEEVVKLLLEAGADPNATDNMGRTPLHNASQHRNKEVFRLLLEAGADPNATDNYGRTPLHDDYWRAREGMIKLLLEAGYSSEEDIHFRLLNVSR